MKVLNRLKAAFAPRVTVTVWESSTVTENGVTRNMTDEEKAAFDAGFEKMGQAFDAMSGAFDAIKPAKAKRQSRAA